MLQMNAIAAYFDSGLQTILGRFVAAERGEDETLSKLASTSMMLLAVASLNPSCRVGNRGDPCAEQVFLIWFAGSAIKPVDDFPEK